MIYMQTLTLKLNSYIDTYTCIFFNVAHIFFYIDVRSLQRIQAFSCQRVVSLFRVIKTYII